MTVASTVSAPARIAGLFWLGGLAEVLTPFAIGLAVGAAVLALTGRDAAGTYALLAQQSLGSPEAIANTLMSATPILFTGLATGLAFRAGVFNIGVEGSLYVGAFAAAWVGFSFTWMPGFALVPLAIVVGGLAGLGWGFLPGLLRGRWRVDEVVTTLMLNYIAILLTSYLVNSWFLAPAVANSMSPLIGDQAKLAPLVAGSQLTIAFPLALVAVAAYWLMFRRTTLGYRLRISGLSPRFAVASGIDLPRAVLVAMLLSGLLGGLAGAFQILGVNYRFIDNFSPGYGFTGIAVALLGRSSAGGILLAAIFFGALTNGGGMIQLFSDIPLDLVNVIQGTVMIFAVVQLWRITRAFRSHARA
jgi:general nucleoside transport system permease protein